MDLKFSKNSERQSEKQFLVRDIFVKGFHAMNEAVHTAGLIQLKHEIMFKLQEQKCQTSKAKARIDKTFKTCNQEHTKRYMIMRGINKWAREDDFKVEKD